MELSFLKMIVKLLLLTLFSACQAAVNEPWWIQMFFPNVSFTGKYHPSNYKVEKSPLFPDYVQNPNDVWSPAYWMPYKQAYAQYWIDLIENTTKAEQEKAKEAHSQAQAFWTGHHNGEYVQNEWTSSNHQNHDQYNQYGTMTGENGASQYHQDNLHHNNPGQLQVNAQTEHSNQYIQQVAAQANGEIEKQTQAIVEKVN